MCGIIGAAAQRDVVDIMLAGLQALEYRGYDSAGFVAIDGPGRSRRLRAKGKVAALVTRQQDAKLTGHTGIAHTRWATHGVPAEHNAHPLQAGSIALVHNGIIENHAALRAELEAAGVPFDSQTDTEVVVQLLARAVSQGQSLAAAMQSVVPRLEGAFALLAVDADAPEHLVATRRGSPLVLGLGIGENFLASDVHALLPVTTRFIYLDDGDFVRLDAGSYDISDAAGEPQQRQVKQTDFSADAIERGEYRHYMAKEIFEQPQALTETLEGRIVDNRPLPNLFGPNSDAQLAAVRAVKILACGTSYHAGLIARYWIERYVGMPCSVEIASEFRYRDPVVADGTLVVAISQSGETTDTLAAFEHAADRGAAVTLAICNVAESSLLRATDLKFLTRAGPEIGVASTKAFTTQLVALALLTATLARLNERESAAEMMVDQIQHVAAAVDRALALDAAIESLAEKMVGRKHALFLGRGDQYPVALEGALKLKEISYIHAEGYPAGELKHGPLALVDDSMPVIAVAPNNDLVGKLIANIEEVRARGGELFVFVDDVQAQNLPTGLNAVVTVGVVPDFIAPIVFTVPLQLMAYHVAVMLGTDVDRPRNLAKSVTVE